MSQDRLPPYSPETELAALACALADSGCAAELRPGHFYDLNHRTVAEGLLELAQAGAPCSVPALVEKLKARGELDRVGGFPFLSGLADRAEAPSTFPYYAGLLADYSTRREVIKAAGAAVEKAFDLRATPGEAVAALDPIYLAAGPENGEEDSTIKKLLAGVIDELDEAARNPGALRGLATGFSGLDSLLGGLRPGQLIILAARPSLGKTSLALNVAAHVALSAGVPVGIFSLEMTRRELAARLLFSTARVNGAEASHGRLRQEDYMRLTVAVPKLAKAPVHIDDAPGVTIGQLCARARTMAKAYRVGLLVVDYLQLLRASHKFTENRAVEIGAVSAGLKNLAKELALPILACAQLNREHEKNERLPKLSDLRDSGTIEQDADCVCLLHNKEDDGPGRQVVGVIVAKNRTGPCGKFDLTFHKPETRFQTRTPAPAREPERTRTPYPDN